MIQTMRCNVRCPSPTTKQGARRWAVVWSSVRSVCAPVLLMAGTVACPVGCAVDVVNVTRQTARVLVTQVDSHAPVRGAQVDLEGSDYEGWMPEQEESERNDLWFSDGMNDPAITNEEGVATLPVNMGMIRGGLFPLPFEPHKDRLTGLTYLFQIHAADITETLTVAMVPGHRSCGRFFQVAVLEIGPSRDVSQEYFARGRAEEKSAKTRPAVAR